MILFFIRFIVVILLSHMFRCCVYTMGSPINNRALFPCQEPPVAMSTWRAHVKAPCEYLVLMSGENQAVPLPDETGPIKSTNLIFFLILNDYSSPCLSPMNHSYFFSIYQVLCNGIIMLLCQCLPRHLL